jgi:hypothetical protein
MTANIRKKQFKKINDFEQVFKWMGSSLIKFRIVKMN